MKSKTRTLFVLLVVTAFVSMFLPGCKLFEASSAARFKQQTDKLDKEGNVTARALTEAEYEGAWIQGNRTVAMPLEDDPAKMNFGHPKAFNITSTTDITPAERAQEAGFKFWEKMTGGMFQFMQQATAMAVAGVTKTPLANIPGSAPDPTAVAQPPAWALELVKAIGELKTEIAKAKETASAPASSVK